MSGYRNQQQNHQEYFQRASEGIFAREAYSLKNRQSAIENLKTWLSGQRLFDPYTPQLRHFIEEEMWDSLIDKFYQTVPFGTGGRRGLMGIGLNRINPWTIKSSAQGHSQYLLQKHPGQAGRGIVIAYGVREFQEKEHYDPDRSNPLRGLTAKKLAHQAAEVYAGNGIKVYIFREHKTTPELSYTIRKLQTLGGAMIDSSHNPPDWCGKKVFDANGGQLIPPHDQELTDEVTNQVEKLITQPFDEAVGEGCVTFIDPSLSQNYYQRVIDLGINKHRQLRIVYTPLHGPGYTSIKPVLENSGFEVHLCPYTTEPSGGFDNVKFNIPNPEVEESFEITIPFANKKGADIILNSDPDADRIGIMVKHDQEWRYLNGNEIGIVLTHYVIENNKQESGLVIKTAVTSDLIDKIARQNGIDCQGDLLVGFKYIADKMNLLEEKGSISKFLFAAEESHGFIAGNYARDKDAAIAALWLSELSAKLKKDGRTLIDYLDSIYAQYGYYKNYLTEIRLPGAEGKEKIDQIQDYLRSERPSSFGNFRVEEINDRWEGKPFKSPTDKLSRNVLTFHLKEIDGRTVKITTRPSGTEPKIKFYFEIGSPPCQIEKLPLIKEKSEELRMSLERSFLDLCYQIIGIDFPPRGYLLFWQLPLKSKLRYFEIEEDIVKLKELPDREARSQRLHQLLKFLGSDPIEKVDRAFQAKYHQPLHTFLDLD